MCAGFGCGLAEFVGHACRRLHVGTPGHLPLSHLARKDLFSCTGGKVTGFRANEASAHAASACGSTPSRDRMPVAEPGDKASMENLMQLRAGLGSADCGHRAAPYPSSGSSGSRWNGSDT